MNEVAEALDALERMLGEVVVGAFASDAVRGLRDEDLLGVLATAARIGRHVEAVLIEGTGQVQERSECLAREGRMTTAMGCRSVNELVQRVTLVSSRTVAGYEKAARGVRREIAPSSGQVLPPDYPALRAAMIDGSVGADGLVAVMTPLSGIAGVAGRAAHLAADEELAASARGEGTDGAPPACANDLRALAHVWAVYLDQDGAEPRDTVAQRKRGLTIGIARDGVIPFRGNMLPDVAAQLQGLFDCINNPRLSGPRFVESPDQADDDDAPREEQVDPRTTAQKQHDALATVLSVAAASGDLPTIGGAAPILVVSVREEDLLTGRGYAQVEGCDEPVSIGVARRIACTGGVQRVVTNTAGRIVSIGILDRIFNHHQRKAITLRDGGCTIPGCRVPARWCEIHHVDEHARGGATHTDNGVLLCWFHHRTIDSGGWQIRMNHGVPEVRGPYWWDARGLWRPATKSRTRMRDRLDLRV